MERTFEFFPYIVMLACVFVISLFCGWRLQASVGDNLKSTEWNKKNFAPLCFLQIPYGVGLIPAREELIFRGPLLLAFSGMSAHAWFWIFVSSIIFGLLHGGGDKIYPVEIFSAYENGKCETDDYTANFDSLQQKRKRSIKRRRICHVVFALFFGLLAGYCTIVYQSLWVSFGIHATMNLSGILAGLVWHWRNEVST